MTTTTAAPAVPLPDLNIIRNRLIAIDKEANFLRKLLRLVGKQANTSATEKNTTTNTAR